MCPHEIALSTYGSYRAGNVLTCVEEIRKVNFMSTEAKDFETSEFSKLEICRAG